MSKPDQAAKTNWTLLFMGWLLVSVSTTISLFFSSVLEYEPCVLCWYQRICLFPMVFILAAGLFPTFDKSVIKYALPLSIAGGLTAFITHYSMLASSRRAFSPVLRVFRVRKSILSCLVLFQFRCSRLLHFLR